MAQLKDLISRYEEIRARKDELADLTKENNAAFDEIKQDIADQMIEDDIPSLTVGDYTYSLQAKTKYNFKSEAALAEMGIDNKYEVLKDNGLDFLVKETVSVQTMNSTFSEMEQNGEELPEEVDAIISRYEMTDIGRRKAPKSRTTAIKREGL